MRALPMILSLAVSSTAGFAQQAGSQTVKDYSSAADIMAMIKKAKSERKQDEPIVTQRILQLAPYTANLEYRASVGPAAVHEKEAELFYVIEGSGTITTGGKLVNQKRTNAENLTGTGIEGGMSRNIGKGDFVIVPENTPHWFSSINGTMVLMSLHVPRAAGH